MINNGIRKSPPPPCWIPAMEWTEIKWPIITWLFRLIQWYDTITSGHHYSNVLLLLIDPLGVNNSVFICTLKVSEFVDKIVNLPRLPFCKHKHTNIHTAPKGDVSIIIILSIHHRLAQSSILQCPRSDWVDGWNKPRTAFAPAPACVFSHPVRSGIGKSVHFEWWLAESQVYGNCISLTWWTHPRERDLIPFITRCMRCRVVVGWWASVHDATTANAKPHKLLWFSCHGQCQANLEIRN